MGKARPVNLETRYFSKYGDAYDFFKEMLHRYPLGEWLSARTKSISERFFGAMKKRQRK